MPGTTTASSEPLVSIVLPTYNGIRYLSESVMSIMQQTYKRWELIIVDDASTDGTPTLIQGFCVMDARIRQIRNSQNRRLPESLNVGFAATKGDLLTWTSDDNCYLPAALSTMVGSLQNDSGAGGVYADHFLIDENTKPVGTCPAKPWHELAFENTVGPCFLYRREVMEQVGQYAADLFLAEDYDFWLRASMRFRFAPLAQKLYLYRVHGDSLTASRLFDVWKAHQRVLHRNLPRMEWLPKEARFLAYLKLAQQSLSFRCYREVVQHMWGAVRIAPGFAVSRLFGGLFGRPKPARS